MGCTIYYDYYYTEYKLTIFDHDFCDFTIGQMNWAMANPFSGNKARVSKDFDSIFKVDLPPKFFREFAKSFGIITKTQHKYVVWAEKDWKSPETLPLRNYVIKQVGLLGLGNWQGNILGTIVN